MLDSKKSIIFYLILVFILFFGMTYTYENPEKTESFINSTKEKLSFDWLSEHNVKGEKIVYNNVYVDKYGNIYHDNINQNIYDENGNKIEYIKGKSNDYIYDGNGNIILSKDELADQINYVVGQEVAKTILQIHNGTTPEAMFRIDAPQYDIINFYCNNETVSSFNYTMQFMFEDEKDMYNLNFQEFCEYMRLYKK